MPITAEMKQEALMDRDENAEMKSQSPYANTSEVSDADAAVLTGVTGRDDNLGADEPSPANLDIEQPIGAQPRSAGTGRHDPGMGANETEDGLSDTEETLRRAAEDETEVDDFEKLPVFDRA